MLICGKKNLESGGWRLAAGFTLIEALIAVGVLGMGLILIAMVFPVGIKLTGTAVERSIGTLAANEGLAKVQLYGLREFQYWPLAIIAEHHNDPRYAPDKWENATYDACENYIYATDYWNWGIDGLPWTNDDLRIYTDWPEFLYPSANTAESRRYHWSALCRRVAPKQVQLIVFATRKVDEKLKYYSYTYDYINKKYVSGIDSDWPMPVPVSVSFDNASGKEKELKIQTGGWAGFSDAPFSFFGGNATIVEDKTGRIYRVSDYKASGGGVRDTLVLTEDWQGGDRVWVVPPAVGSTRNPVVGVMQTTIVLP